MALSMDGRSDDVSCRVTYMSAGSPNRPEIVKAKKLSDPWANQTEGQVADLKKRIPALKRLIADCGRLAVSRHETSSGQNLVRMSRTRRTASESMTRPIPLIRPMPRRRLRGAII